MSRIVVNIATPGGESYDFEVTEHSFVIGRSPDCDLQIPSTKISSRHLQVDRLKRGFHVTDLGSKNGTTLSGSPLPPFEPALRALPIEVELADIRLRITDYDAQEHSNSLSADQSVSRSRDLIRGILGANLDSAALVLKVVSGKAKGLTAPIPEGMPGFRIGSGTDVELNLLDPDLVDAPVLVKLNGARYEIHPHAWRPVGLNGRVVSRAVPLNDGDILSLGENLIHVEDPLAPVLQELAVDDSRPAAQALVSHPASKIGPGRRRPLWEWALFACALILGVAALVLLITLT
ncbi:MAG: FHA domain-containing protein [Myxococcales bacterium]|nr:FHA domain-containing protein [Myxococcales bacterium]